MSGHRQQEEFKSARPSAFGHYLRTGQRFSESEWHALFERKCNPNHDPRDGRFTSGPGGAASRSHTVRHGETLSGIAHAHGLKTAALARANGIANPDHIRARQVLVIPAAGAAHPTAPVPPSRPNPPAAPKHTAPAARPALKAPANGSGAFHTSAISSVAEAQALVTARKGEPLGRDAQCASLTKALAPSVGAASTWQRGELVKGNASIPVGTPIATFNFFGQKGTHGYGPPGSPGGASRVSHTGIYLGQGKGGLRILHQYRHSGGPQVFVIPWDKWGHSTSEAGNRYYAIRKKH